jgi:cardiolipin synthase (CMP-forming)
MRRWLRHLPNALTILRLLLVPPLAVLLLRGEYTTALWVAAIAGLTDALDGALARVFGWQSWLGGVLDPLADKLLLVTGYACLWWQGVVPTWLVMLILGRDVIIVAGAVAWHRLIQRLEPEPSLLGKTTTALQIGFLLVCLVSLGSPMEFEAVLPELALITGAATLVSGLHYVLRFGRRAWATRRA